MKIKKIIPILVLVIIVSISIGFFIIKDKNKKYSHYSLGKTPHSYQYTFSDDFLLYKDNVQKDNETTFSGLYLKNLKNNEESILLSDEYYGCANKYKDSVIYISTDYNIMEEQLDNKECKVLIKGNGRSVKDALVIEEVLYYIQETEEDIFTLYAFDLQKNKKEEITTNIYPYYLYHVCGNVGVISKEMDKILICNIEKKVIKEYNKFEHEIQGFLDDGTVIYYYNNEIYQKEKIDSNKKKTIIKKEDIYRIIVKQEEMLICTLDQYGLIEVYIYKFSENKLQKVANANSIPRDFNEKFIVCASEEEGLGNIELINREDGNIFPIIKQENEVENLSVNLTNNYKESISSEDKKELESLMKDYYEHQFPYKLIEFQIADNDMAEYKYYQEYDVGNVVIFKVRTEHEVGNIYRHIVFARDGANDDWKRINEGY